MADSCIPSAHLWILNRDDIQQVCFIQDTNDSTDDSPITDLNIFHSIKIFDGK